MTFADLEFKLRGMVRSPCPVIVVRRSERTHIIVPVNRLEEFRKIPGVTIQGDWVLGNIPVDNFFWLQPTGQFTVKP